MANKPRPASHADPDRPEPTRGCICDPKAFLVATFVNQRVARLAIEHRAYCPIGHVRLSVAAYLHSGEKRPM